MEMFKIEVLEVISALKGHCMFGDSMPKGRINKKLIKSITKIQLHLFFFNIEKQKLFCKCPIALLFVLYQPLRLYHQDF